jgi:hypothetical protein
MGQGSVGNYRETWIMATEANRKKVFISWSRECAKLIAEKLKRYIECVFPVDVFVSSASISCGESFRTRIEREMADCFMGVMVLTEANKGAEWLMFEAGAIAGVGAKRLCSINFNRRDNAIESPVSVFQAVNDLPKRRDKRSALFSLFKSINEELQVYTPENLAVVFDHYWFKFEDNLNFWEVIERILNDKNNGCDLFIEESRTIRQLHLNLDGRSIVHAHRPSEQSGNDLECVIDAFQAYLKINLPSELAAHYLIKKNETHDESFIINKTRFSTFFAILDSEDNLLLYQREHRDALTTVENPALDLYGSVAFSNRSLKEKLKDHSGILKAEVDNISTLPVIAIEENLTVGSNMPSIVVVMFGYEIRLAIKFSETGQEGTGLGPVRWEKVDDLLNHNRFGEPGSAQWTAKLEAYLAYRAKSRNNSSER